MEIVQIRKMKKGDLPFTKNSCYKFHSMKKFPNLIYKVGGILFFDMEEWAKMAEKAKKEHIRKSSVLRENPLVGRNKA